MGGSPLNNFSFYLFLFFLARCPALDVCIYGYVYMYLKVPSSLSLTHLPTTLKRKHEGDWSDAFIHTYRKNTKSTYLLSTYLCTYLLCYQLTAPAFVSFTINI
ncbi:hypothetical protein F5X96DRAFT_640884 [Biscogniauxia mediterranea]|nr:hypothetical protein F5X96DRAFT_640884 [Biscogniauxia mediterranea]